MIRDNKLLTARINVFCGKFHENFTLITPEAYLSFEACWDIATDLNNPLPKTAS